MTTQADTGFDSAFGIATDNTFSSVTDVAEVTNITPPSPSRATVDATHLKSPGNYEEFISGVRSGGEASISLNYLPAVNDTLVAQLDSDDLGHYQITFPNGIRLQFAALCTDVEFGELANDEKMMLTATFKASGAPTLAAAT